MNTVYPFTAILGQEGMKNALIWNAINPKIGGVLLSGEKGTAKSTVVRALAALRKAYEIVELPLNITEDRLIGTIDMQAAIVNGLCRFEPGVLSKADQNFLYVDEVNLLSDHIINSLLDVAASGINHVDREGISYSHPSRFVLVGSMNPEEGKLRPQFLDRFGLYVEVSGTHKLEERTEIIRRRISYERDCDGFIKEWEYIQEKMQQKIDYAIASLDKVKVTDNAIRLASTLSNQANCAGHWAELVIIETAKAIAAFEGRIILKSEDIRIAASHALPHRIRDNQEPIYTVPEDQQEDKEQREESTDGSAESQETQEQESQAIPDADQNNAGDNDGNNDEDFQNTKGALPQEKEEQEDIQTPDEPFAVKSWLNNDVLRTVNLGSGRRSIVRTSSKLGRYIRAAFPHGNINDIALDATLRAAAIHQKGHKKDCVLFTILPQDFRIKVREKRIGNTILFVVDASGSMGANQRMKTVKAAICSLLSDAYQKRDKVGMIAFRNNSAEMILNITRSVDLAQKQLDTLPTGGRTPLAEGLRLAREVLRVAKIKDKDMLPVLVLISDGRANASRTESKPADEALNVASLLRDDDIKCIVIDTEKDFITVGIAQKIAEKMSADYFKIENLSAEFLVNIVSTSIQTNVGM